MGGPSPDTVSGPAMPEQALTLAEMVVAGWSIRGRCGKCETVLDVDARSLIRAQGPDLVMWGRMIRCPRVHDGRWRCEGRMDFLAQTIPGGSWVRLHQLSDAQVTRIKAGRDPYARRYVRPRDAPADPT